MSVILIDSFSFPSPDLGGATLVINVFFNDVTAAITYTEEPPTGITSVTQIERGKLYGAFMGNYLNESQTTQYRIEADLSAPFAYIASSEPYTPNPPQCDLTLNVTSTNETSQGADDGTINVSATSTFDNIEVSIDGTAFFTSPHLFTGLTPNEYTVISRDSNGCTASKLVTVEEFENPITSRPEVLIAPGKISRWNAAFNPIVFTFNNTPDPLKPNYRIEIEITSQSGTVTGQWSPNTSGFTRADISAYLQGLVNAKDNFKYDVINWRDMDRAASFTIRYRGVWDGDSTVWYNGSQPYYVTWSAMQLGDKYGGNMAEYVPMISGGAISPASFQWSNIEQVTPYEDANLQVKINNIVTVDSFGNENGNFTSGAGSSYSVQSYATNEPQDAGFLRLRVRKNGTVVFFSQLANTPGASFVYSGIVDIGATYIIESESSSTSVSDPEVNIPDNTYTAPVTSTFAAKWLTLFKEPTYNIGYPFDLSFIFSEYIIGSGVKMRTISLDINRQPIAGGTVNSFILNNDAGYILNTDTSRLIIQQGALPPVSNDGILEALGINRLMMAGNPSIGVEYFQVQLYTGTDESPNFITQPIVVKVNTPCNDPFIYLKWLNTLGGWDYFRFGHDQVLSLNTSDGISIDRNVFDWSNDETIADTITKNAVRRISFGATVGENKIDGLVGLHKSTHIMLQVGFNPIKFHTVTLGVGGFEIKRTKSNTADLRFQISLPEINIQRQ